MDNYYRDGKEISPYFPGGTGDLLRPGSAAEGIG